MNPHRIELAELTIDAESHWWANVAMTFDRPYRTITKKVSLGPFNSEAHARKKMNRWITKNGGLPRAHGQEEA